MNYRENKNSAINRAMSRLEDVKDSAATASPQSVVSSALPLLQLENIFKNSQKTFGIMAQKFETKLKEDPWDMLRKVAIGSFVLGIILGHHSRPSKTKVRQ